MLGWSVEDDGSGSSDLVPPEEVETLGNEEESSFAIEEVCPCSRNFAVRGVSGGRDTASDGPRYRAYQVLLTQITQ